MKPKLSLKIAAFEKPFILKIESRGVNGENCYFSGTMGRSANDMIKYGNFNCTVTRTDGSEGYGHMDLATSKYNGMNGVVQAGSVDLGLAVQMIPMENDDFLYGPVVTSSRITILSTYAAHDGSLDETVDVSEIFGQIRVDVWLTFIAFLFLFFLLLWLGKRLFQASDHVNSLWTIVTFVCGKESFGHRHNSFFECFILFLTLFIFLSHQYFANFMTTELVRPNIPLVVDSFDDILNYRQNNRSLLVDIRTTPKEKRKQLRPLRPFFLKAIRSIKNFENANNGTVRKDVYKQAIRMNGDREKSQVDFQDAFKEHFVNGIFEGTSIIIDAETVARMIRVTMCDMLTQSKYYSEGKFSRYMFFARNASIPYLLGYVYSRTVTHAVRERLDSIIYRFAESGIAGKLVIELSHAITEPSHRIARCLMDEIYYENSEVEQLELKHVTIIFMSLAILFSLSSFLVIVEGTLLDPRPKKKSRKAQRNTADSRVHAQNMLLFYRIEQQEDKSRQLKRLVHSSARPFNRSMQVGVQVHREV